MRSITMPFDISRYIFITICLVILILSSKIKWKSVDGFSFFLPSHNHYQKYQHHEYATTSRNKAQKENSATRYFIDDGDEIDTDNLVTSIHIDATQSTCTFQPPPSNYRILILPGFFHMQDEHKDKLLLPLIT